MERALISKFRMLRTPDANGNIFADIWKIFDGRQTRSTENCFPQFHSSPSRAPVSSLISNEKIPRYTHSREIFISLMELSKTHETIKRTIVAEKNSPGSSNGNLIPSRRPRRIDILDIPLETQKRKEKKRTLSRNCLELEDRVGF